jgi:MYXO-CTERM domain-containing protein
MRSLSALSFLPLLFFTGAASPVRAAVLFSENFESRTLGPYISPSESGGDGTDWTDVAPTGWVRDQGATPVGGPPEFFGFTFHDKQSWINTEADQNRSSWVGGIGTVMVADPDAYDDGAVDIAGQLFNVRITTPAISLSGVAANSVILGFDSSFRVEGNQTALVDVTFDGTNFINLLTYNSSLLTDGDTINALHALQVNNPSSGTMSFRFSLVNAENNWWFAVDNVSVTGTIPEPSAGLLSLLAVGGLCFRRRRA